MLHTTSSSPGDFVSSCIREIKRQHPQLNTATLSKKLDVHQSTLSRIENRGVAKPSLNLALNIARMAYPNEGDYTKLMEQHYPEYNTVYSGESKKAVFVKKEAEQFFESPATHEYMLLATSSSGVTEAFVKEQYGQIGLDAINKLVDSDVLKKVGSRFVLGPTLNAGQTTVHKLLQNLINVNYEVEGHGQKGNFMSVQYNSVDKNYVMPKLAKVLKDAQNEMQRILQDPTSRGDEVVWVGMAMDSLAKMKSQMENQ